MHAWTRTPHRQESVGILANIRKRSRSPLLHWTSSSRQITWLHPLPKGRTMVGCRRCSRVAIAMGRLRGALAHCGSPSAKSFLSILEELDTASVSLSGPESLFVCVAWGVWMHRNALPAGGSWIGIGTIVVLTRAQTE